MCDLNGEPIIEINELSFTYAGASRQALNAINLKVGKGDFIGITGPTGVGKTTLSYCLNGIIPHFLEGVYQGDVRIKGRSVFDFSSQELSRSIGSVFQDPESQLVSATVEEELAFGPENLAVEPEEIRQRINYALKAVGIEHLQNASINSLSGGQKQRVAIAAVLTMAPEILILDEPTAELDPIGTDEVFKVLKELNVESGITIIIIEHKLEHLAQFCNRLLIMNEGQIRIEGTPEEVFKEWRAILKLGVKPPQVSEFFGKILDETQPIEKIPVTLEAAKNILKNILDQEVGDE
ncbi:MAG TPA: ABC transporter ATP-binding protein [Bacillota bacterium]|nr:ABC transporter ATP-binding protein [Bacillota bacterium]